MNFFIHVMICELMIFKLSYKILIYNKITTKAEICSNRKGMDMLE